jgi:DNA-binding NtrC family response regulator
MVDTAENGKSAIDKSNRNFHNLAMIDIRLPDMEGTELLTALRETTLSMVKIIVAGYRSLPNSVEAVKRGADDYLVKPFKMVNALDTI